MSLGHYVNQSKDKTSYHNNKYNLKVQSQRKIGYFRRRKPDVNYCAFPSYDKTIYNLQSRNPS